GGGGGGAPPAPPPHPPPGGGRAGGPPPGGGPAPPRLAGTVAHQLARRGGGTGVATLCVGVGQGLALVLDH
ncbi:hypothetical protein ACE14D_23210, partial [Streptomyces sp. Act-28]